MASKKLKDYYNKSCALLLAEKISAVDKKFSSQDFIRQVCSGIRGKEFLARQDIFSQALHSHLNGTYLKRLSTLSRILGPELQQAEGMFTYGWWLWPIGRYIEHHGHQNPKKSTEFIYELTKRFTGEFAIRPLLEANPKATLRVMKKWSKDKNVHVRRLASEGIRIRLPWAKKSRVFLDNFKECREILENLKASREKFVQKSVGNNLNDLLKEDYKLGMTIIKEWQHGEVPPETAWIIKHGTRSFR